MSFDPKELLKNAEMHYQHYERELESGRNWCIIPYAIFRNWIHLLRQDTVCAADAMALVRKIDQCDPRIGDLAFFGTCNTIRLWYREICEREFKDAFSGPDR